MDGVAASVSVRFPLLGPCGNLEDLSLEFGVNRREVVARDHDSSLAGWAKDLPALKSLRVVMVDGVSEAVTGVLGSLPAQLTALAVRGYFDGPSGVNTVLLYQQIAKQHTLESLEIFDYGSGLGSAFPDIQMLPLVRQAFADTITGLPALRRLDVNMPVSHALLVGILRSCPLIESLSLNASNPPVVASAWLKEIARFRFLKELIWTSESFFRVPTLVRFITQLKQDPLGSHEGFYIRLGCQERDFRFSKQGLDALRTAAASLGGTFTVKYLDEDEWPLTSSSSDTGGEDSGSDEDLGGEAEADGAT